MAVNKGKKGEMDLVITLAQVVKSEEDRGRSCDITRHTNTNTADSGADVVLESPKIVVDELLARASGAHVKEDQNGSHSAQVICNQLAMTDTKTIKTRFDNKNTDSKQGADVVREFVADIRKNPDCDAHVLAGGNGLTRGGEQEMLEAQKAYGDSKLIAYISNQGLLNISSSYVPESQDSIKSIPSDEDNSKK